MTEEQPLALRGAPAYQLFMLSLCVLALTAIVVQNAFTLDPEIELVLEYADTALCAAFLIDFVLTLVRTPNRGWYLVTWGWLDVLSSIPTLDFVRWGRRARIARIARVSQFTPSAVEGSTEPTGCTAFEKAPLTPRLALGVN